MESAEYKAVSFLEHPVNLNLWVDKPTTGPIEKIIDDDFFSDTSSCNSIDVDLVPQIKTPDQERPILFIYDDLENWKNEKNIFKQTDDTSIQREVTAELQKEYFNAVFTGD